VRLAGEIAPLASGLTSSVLRQLAASPFRVFSRGIKLPNVAAVQLSQPNCRTLLRLFKLTLFPTVHRSPLIDLLDALSGAQFRMTKKRPQLGGLRPQVYSF
jgi:hypothetical protein